MTSFRACYKCPNRKTGDQDCHKDCKIYQKAKLERIKETYNYKKALIDNNLTKGVKKWKM